jgi:methionyl-tRNA formyltransferase
MRVVFLGSPPFAVPILRALLESAHEVVGVVTQPARPKGRGRHSEPSQISRMAVERGLPLIEPQTTRDPGFLTALRALGPDVLLVASYGEILRQDVLDLAPRGAFNVHASLLPRWRGAAPIQRAILAGDRVTGVTVQRMVLALDAGDVVTGLELAIGPEETSGELLTRLAELGARAAIGALDLIESGRIQPVPQDPSLVTLAPKLSKGEGQLDWSRPAEDLARRVRALTPWPGARTSEPGGRELTIEQAAVVAYPPAPPDAEPGTILVAHKQLVVATGHGALELRTLKPAGKRAMDASSYLLGARLTVGQRLGGAA